MNTKYQVRVLASGCYGIAPLTVEVEYNGNPDEFHKQVMSKVLACGYTAILHFQAVDGVEYGKLAFVPDVMKNAELVEYILSKIEEAGRILKIKEALKKSKSTGKPADENCFLASDGVWRHTGGFDEERARLRYMDLYHELQGIRITLLLLGVDVDDEQGKRQILTNLGFYRTPVER